MNVRNTKTVFLSLIAILLATNAVVMWRSRCSACPGAAAAGERSAAEHSRNASAPQQRRRRPAGCPWNVLYTQPAYGRGRFGNRLLEYASAWAAAAAGAGAGRRNATLLVLSDDVAWAMRTSFGGGAAACPTKSEFVDALRRRREDDACACWMEWRLQEAPVAKESADMKQLMERQLALETPVSVRPHIILEEFIVPVLKQLRQHLQPLPALSAYVHTTMRTVTQSLKKNTQEVTFVSVHVRLTDYPDYIKMGFGTNAQPVDVNYYLHATDYMIEQLKKRNASNIVFLVVSDDQIWCTTNLIPALEQLLTSKHWTRGDLAVRWSGSSSYIHDFALLSSCNHSIIAYGTFGGGAALLAGGMTVVYDINRGKGGNTSGGAMRFQALIPEWTLLY